MTFDLKNSITLVAFLIMCFSLWRVIVLKNTIPGGTVGRSWSFLLALVAMFAVAYLAIPFLGELKQSVLALIVSFIFLFGAIYVLITVNLIEKVVKVLTE